MDWKVTMDCEIPLNRPESPQHIAPKIALSQGVSVCIRRRSCECCRIETFAARTGHSKYCVTLCTLKIERLSRNGVRKDQRSCIPEHKESTVINGHRQCCSGLKQTL